MKKTILVTGFVSFFVPVVALHAQPDKQSKKHCQPNDTACLQSMKSYTKPASSNEPLKTYDANGHLLSEKVGDTTTYYHVDEKGNSVQQYKETVKQHPPKN